MGVTIAYLASAETPEYKISRVVFSALHFLFAFLPAFLVSYFLTPRVLRNGLLLVFSLAFYLYGSGYHLITLIAVAMVSWLFGLLLARRKRKLWLVLPIVCDLGCLAYFKYANFAVANWTALAEQWGLPAFEWTEVFLPVGLSFYTFQAITYVVDVYRGHAAVLRNPATLLLYISMFPQLVAGPIVRYAHIAGQLRERSTTVEAAAAAIGRFAHGLFKKVVIADSVGEIADAAFALSAEQTTAAAAWIGTLAYTVQIYFDFSAYSDMAIGMGALLGFRFPENFTRPYSAPSVTDFWRRWHRTLSGFFRDYVYIPLGGSSGSPAKTYRNLWIVFLLSGLWHGAAWNFVAWGAYHGAWLTIERRAGWRLDDTGRVGRRFATFVIVVFSWTLFRADTISQAGVFYSHMLLPTELEVPYSVALTLTHKNLLALLGGLLVVFLPAAFVTGVWIEQGRSARALTYRTLMLLVGLPYCLIVAASQNFTPFLYFRF